MYYGVDFEPKLQQAACMPTAFLKVPDLAICRIQLPTNFNLIANLKTSRASGSR